MVVDETGEKMSKVKGNTIDPLDLIHGSSFEDVVRKALPGAPRTRIALMKFKKAYPSTAQMGTGFPRSVRTQFASRSAAIRLRRGALAYEI